MEPRLKDYLRKLVPLNSKRLFGLFNLLHKTWLGKEVSLYTGGNFMWQIPHTIFQVTCDTLLNFWSGAVLTCQQAIV